MEVLLNEEKVYQVVEHYEELAAKCYKILNSHPEEVPNDKVSQYINNDCLKRILIARDYNIDKSVEMWQKWFVKF
jgi:hypothetical protein